MYILNTTQGIFPFTVKKEYSEQNPVYFILNEPREEVILLCRELTPTEKETHFKNISYVIDTETQSSKPCLVISSEKSIERAEILIASYQRGINQLHRKGLI